MSKFILRKVFLTTASSLRSLISALFWLTIGIAAAICIGLTPVSQDPYLVWMYASLGIVGFVSGCVFYFFSRGSSRDMPGLEGEEGEVEGVNSGGLKV